jgi:hypothetical protein
VVISLRDVLLVEKFEKVHNDSSFDNAIIITMKLANSNDKPPVFILSHILERSFFLKKISVLLGNLET